MDILHSHRGKYGIVAVLQENLVAWQVRYRRVMAALASPATS